MPVRKEWLEAPEVDTHCTQILPHHVSSTVPKSSTDFQRGAWPSRLGPARHDGCDESTLPSPRHQRFPITAPLLYMVDGVPIRCEASAHLDAATIPPVSISNARLAAVKITRPVTTGSEKKKLFCHSLHNRHHRNLTQKVFGETRWSGEPQRVKSIDEVGHYHQSITRQSKRAQQLCGHHKLPGSWHRDHDGSVKLVTAPLPRRAVSVNNDLATAPVWCSDAISSLRGAATAWNQRGELRSMYMQEFSPANRLLDEFASNRKPTPKTVHRGVPTGFVKQFIF